MNLEQWLFEYSALRKRENEEREWQNELLQAQIRAIRDTLIGVFGLNVLGEKTEEERKEDEKKGFDPDMPKFVPGSMIFGHPSIMKHFLDELEKRKRTGKSATDDVVFDQFSNQLLQQLKSGQSDLSGDMIPLLTEDLRELERNSYWHSVDAQAALIALGVRPRGSDGPAPHIAVKPKVFEDRQGSMMSEKDLELAGETPRRDRSPVSLEAELEKFRKALSEAE